MIVAITHFYLFHLRSNITECSRTKNDHYIKKWGGYDISILTQAKCSDSETSVLRHPFLGFNKIVYKPKQSPYTTMDRL